MADPLKIITEVLRQHHAATSEQIAEGIIAALKAGGVMLMPTEVIAAKAKLTRDDLRVGMVCRMRKGGVRRIDGLAGGMWGDVSWTRIDPGPYCGRTGKQAKHYFAGEVMEVING